MAVEEMETGGELAALGAHAAALDAEVGADDFGPAPGAPGGAADIGPDPVAETSAVLSMVVGMLSPLLPYLPEIYTPEKIAALAGAYVPVAEKYGWQSAGWLDKYGAEVVLIATAAPVAMQTAQAHRAWQAAREAERRAKSGERVAVTVKADEPLPAGPGPGTIQFGTAVPVGAVDGD